LYKKKDIFLPDIHKKYIFGTRTIQ